MDLIRFYQETPESAWLPVLDKHAAAKVLEVKAPFATVLACDHDFKNAAEMTAEDFAKVKYYGPLYADFDCASIEDAIKNFNKFLDKLVEQDVDLSCCCLYASGGKGFHCTVPPETFTKMPAQGVANLPAIYKEIANDLVVETLDMRVYTGRRGRMWRTENILRPNGMHKVRITVDEARSMTPELYKTLCSAPRTLPPPADPVEAPGLALLYTSAKAKIEKATRGKKKSSADAALIKKHNGELPPSIAALANGEHIRKDAGFHKIAMQLAIAAHALGKTEDEFLKACDGLCENHQSDSDRYNTPTKRRAELRRAFAYMDGNPCYEFSIGGIKSLLDKEFSTPDLEGGYEHNPETEIVPDAEDFGTTLGMRVNATGIWKKGEEGYLKCCAIGITDPVSLRDIKTGAVIGFDVECHLDGVPKGRRLLGMDSFQSRNKFQQFTLSMGASVQATDGQVGALTDLLRRQAEKKNKQIFTVSREGIDIVSLPDGGGTDIVWASPSGTFSQSGKDYRYKGFHDPAGSYRTDLMSAPELADTPEVRKFFDHLFEINNEITVAKFFGWMLACFLRQLIHHHWECFPMVQIYGLPGTGKSQSLNIFTRLHYYEREAVQPAASGTTSYGLNSLAAASASMPLLIHEFSRKELRQNEVHRIIHMLKNSWDQNSMVSGHVNRDSGASFVELRAPTFSSPVGLVGQSFEPDTAIVERSVQIPMSKHQLEGRAEHDEYAMTHRRTLSSLGRACVEAIVHSLDMDLLKSDLDKFKAQVEKARRGVKVEPRQVKSAAILMTGLNLGKDVMASVFGDTFDARFDRLIDVMAQSDEASTIRVVSEVAKVLGTLALMTRHDDEKANLQLGKDYTLSDTLFGGKVIPTLDIKMKSAFAKYSRYCKDTGQERMYVSDEAFIAAFVNYKGQIDKFCDDNDVLKDSPFTTVFRFNCQYLDEERIEHFKGDER
jgi:hypothetical protein